MLGSQTYAKFAQGLLRPIPHDVDDLEVSTVRHRPESLQKLCDSTKFNKRELQLMYRGFKQGCPNGIVSLVQFQEIYSQFFPYGRAEKYAQLVFNTFDADQNGTINFEEFAIGLSVISRGTEREKLEWIFNLYDAANAGKINRTEMAGVVNSVYELVGKCHYSPAVMHEITMRHVNEVFSKMDTNKDGFISREEFIAGCQLNERVCNALHLFDTRF